MKHPITRFSTEIFTGAMFSEVQYLAPLRYDEYNTEHNVTTQMHKLEKKYKVSFVGEIVRVFLFLSLIYL
jgi:hypothetical protein